MTSSVSTPPRDNALRQVASVGLQGLKRPAFERLDVIVIDSRSLREDFLLGHHGQQFRFRDAAGPLLPELGAVLAEVSYELAQEL
jgi:hypothetical protein